MIASLYLSLCACLFPQQTVSQQVNERLSVVILDLEAIGLSKSEVWEYTDFLTSELVASQEYTFIGRRRRDAMLLEREMADLNHSDEAQRLTVGRVTGADRIIAGRLTRDDGLYSLSISIIDVATTREVYLGEYRYASLSELYEESAIVVRDILSALALQPGKGKLADRAEEQREESSTSAQFSRPSFRSEIQQLVLKDNPAVLGIQNEDLKILISQSVSWLGRDVSRDVHTAQTIGAESILGIELTFGDRMGFGCSVDFLFDDSEIDTSYVFDYLGGPSTHFHPRIKNLGSTIGIGYRASQATSVGTALRIHNEWNDQEDGSAVVSKESAPYVEIRAGVLKEEDPEDPWERYILGLSASYSNTKTQLAIVESISAADFWLDSVSWRKT